MNELQKSHGNANLLASMSAMVLPIVTSLAGFLEAVLRELLEKILASVEYKTREASTTVQYRSHFWASGLCYLKRKESPDHYPELSHSRTATRAPMAKKA